MKGKSGFEQTGRKKAGPDRAFVQAGVLAAGLILICVICRLTVLRSYSIYIPLDRARQEMAGENGFRMKIDEPDVFRPGEPRVRNGYLQIPIEPGRSGASFLTVQDPAGENVGGRWLRVGPLGTVYDLSSGGFTGDRAVVPAMAVFWILVFVIMLRHFFMAKGPAFYHYATIYYVGISLFSLITALLITRAAVLHFLYPVRYTMFVTYQAIRSAGGQFMMLTMPLAAAFAISMVICNIALLRHEKPRIQNVLGILISLLLILGETLGWFLFNMDNISFGMQARVLATLQHTYAVVFVYFECMLFGSIICGILAARHQPAPDKSFIVILGCWFRKDGSLPPLLKGRADRAIDFWKRQKEQTGREALLIPTGGQGRDESMPEAEAIRRYLISREIPEHLIRTEERAANTYENMAFSGEIIRGIDPEGQVIYVTTNYHVFRSGVWAGLAGLPAEGIGSRTKWWFWPNAFMREVIGLFRNRWKQELAFLAVIVVFFGIISMTLW